MRITVVPAFPSAPVNIPHPKNWPLIEDEGAFALNLVHGRAGLHGSDRTYDSALQPRDVPRRPPDRESIATSPACLGQRHLSDRRLRKDDLAIVHFDPYSLTEASSAKFIQQPMRSQVSMTFAFHLDCLPRMASGVGHQVCNGYGVFDFDRFSEARFCAE
jgi:hypothetical protein